MYKVTSVVLAAALLGGCSGMGPRETTGTVVGGVAGAAIGGGLSRNAFGAGLGAVAGA